MKAFLVLSVAAIFFRMCYGRTSGRSFFGNDESISSSHQSSAPANEFPYLVSIQILYGGSWRHLCSGTLLEKVTVITSARCALDCGSFNCRIVAGTNDLSEMEPSQQIKPIVCARAHPKFDGLYKYDFGIIHTLDFNITTGEVDVIGNAIHPPLDECFSPGWGGFGFKGKFQSVNITTMTHDDCKKVYGINFTDEMMCGYDSTPKQLAENGGPLLCDGIFFGIGSWADPPSGNTKQHPAVFSNIAKEIDWVNSQRNSTC